MRLYIVTWGYQDYSLEGVYSTREKAEAYIAAYRAEFGEAASEPLDIIVWELDGHEVRGEAVAA